MYQSYVFFSIDQMTTILVCLRGLSPSLCLLVQVFICFLSNSRGGKAPAHHHQKGYGQSPQPSKMATSPAAGGPYGMAFSGVVILVPDVSFHSKTGGA
jgi:hypothetical protein